MELDKIIVVIISIFGIGFTYWFFLMKKDQFVSAENSSIDIIVDGGYKPAALRLKSGKEYALHFLRKDSSSCLEEVVLSDFKVRKFLPLNEKVTIKIKPEKKGEYDFSCGMNMFHGKIVVEE